MQTLTGIIQDYAWGSTDGIPAALGTDATDSPQAEYWLGAHPKAPSVLPDGTTLDTLLDRQPELIGTATIDRFGPRLPFLFKILSARQALSLQAHPSRAQAIDGFERENKEGIPLDAPHRNYRDDWPKPEALVALTEFHGLCGFRDPGRTRDLFGRLNVPAADGLVEPLADLDGIARVFLEVLALGDTQAELIEAVVEAARPYAEAEPSDDPEFNLFCTTAVELARDYPGDPGILAALLLNRIVLQPGDAFAMPAGNMHAYLRGTGIEIMANSDNVLRGGLTPKHIDVDELAQVVDFLPGFPGLIEPVELSPGVLQFRTQAPEFGVFEIRAASDQGIPETDSARILLVVEGSLTLTDGVDTLELRKGQAVFLGAGEQIRVDGDGQAFMASAGAHT